MKPSRNDPCPCGSGKKYKHCCERKEQSQPAASTPSPAEFTQLIALYNAQRYAELEARARKLVEHYPNTGFGWKLLGGALLMQGKDALPAFEQTVALLPGDAEAHYNLGVALKELGRLDEAVASYQRAVRIKPEYAEAHGNLGNALKELGQLQNAVNSYRRAVEIRPSAEAHFHLGNLLKDLGQFDEVAASYRSAIKIKPDYVEAHGNLGNALAELGQFNSAVLSFRRALEIKPDFAEAHNNLGNTLKNLGLLQEAMACYRRAVEINPSYAEAYSNLGGVLNTLNQGDYAIKNFNQALAINPGLAEAHTNLGLALNDLGQIHQSIASHRRALEISPDYPEAHSNLGNALKDAGQYDEAVISYRRALELKPDLAEARSNLLFSMNYMAGYTPAAYLAEARLYGQRVTQKATAPFSTWSCVPQPARLRVGLVSGDLNSHPVGYFLESLLTQIDPGRIELIAYCTQIKEDALTARIKPHFAAWKSLVGLNDKAAAQLIHADGVHVLLDLAGHTAHNRLPVFAWKPAPVQAAWLGYFATTGVAEMDYLIADQIGVPEAHRAHFTESVWSLPDTRLCFSAPSFDVPVAPLPVHRNGHVTFGSFQNLSKVGEAVLATWARVLNSVPGSRLRWQCKQWADRAMAQKMSQRLQGHGIDAARVMLLKGASYEAYLAAHAEVDLILDTFPYPGGTTTCEALWMGVPTLSLAGDTLLARQGASLLAAAGLAEWAVSSEADYINSAVAFSGDLTKLATLRAGLRQQVGASPLFDAPRFARNLEEALWGMWQNKVQRENQ